MNDHWSDCIDELLAEMSEWVQLDIKNGYKLWFVVLCLW